jgi:serine/threonine protein phosphatase PrpC
MTNTCSTCGTPYEPGDRFCEECGKKLPIPSAVGLSPCAACGSTEFDADGYCIGCGTKQEPPHATHGEAVVGPGLAAATDVGLSHNRNDDAFAVDGQPQGGTGATLVVCDGVSRSQSPDVASAAAANVARNIVAHAAQFGGDVEAAMREAIVKAHETVCAVPYDRQHPLDPPAATIVMASAKRLDARRWAVTVGWLGDSRIYWIARTGNGMVLTRDHSWFNEVVASGEMTEAEAAKDPRAHAITKCLGTVDFSQPTPCPEPDVRTVEVTGDGWLVACTDGLWNYAPTPLTLAQAANGQLWTDGAIDICRRLVAFANDKGGQDNITVAMARLGD